jgi:hypothetical protein
MVPYDFTTAIHTMNNLWKKPFLSYIVVATFQTLTQRVHHVFHSTQSFSSPGMWDMLFRDAGRVFVQNMRAKRLPSWPSLSRPGRVLRCTHIANRRKWARTWISGGHARRADHRPGHRPGQNKTCNQARCGRQGPFSYLNPAGSENGWYPLRSGHRQDVPTGQRWLARISGR